MTTDSRDINPRNKRERYISELRISFARQILELQSRLAAERHKTENLKTLAKSLAARTGDTQAASDRDWET